MRRCFDKPVAGTPDTERFPEPSIVPPASPVKVPEPARRVTPIIVTTIITLLIKTVFLTHEVSKIIQNIVDFIVNRWQFALLKWHGHSFLELVIPALATTGSWCAHLKNNFNYQLTKSLYFYKFIIIRRLLVAGAVVLAALLNSLGRPPLYSNS